MNTEKLHELARQQIERKFIQYNLLHFWQIKGSASDIVTIYLVLSVKEKIYFIRMIRFDIIKEFDLIIDNTISIA
jgi:hypothetical protein